MLGANVVEVYRGWPQTGDLATDLKGGTACEISIYSLPGGSRDTSRYPRDWQAVATTPSTLTVTSAANTATFGGTATAGQLAGLLVTGIGFAYTLQAGDTPSTIAQALANAIATDGQMVATVVDATITVTDPLGVAYPVIGSVAGTATAQREMRRQEQRLVVTCWCPTPALRDRLAGAIDGVLAAVDWLTLADGTQARLRYASTNETDRASLATLYCRDLTYTVEYPTTQTVTAPLVLFPLGLMHVRGVNVPFAAASPVAGVLQPDSNNASIDTALGLQVQPTP